MINKIFSSSYTFYFSLILVIIQIVAVFSDNNETLQFWFINSDVLYQPSLYKDLFVDGGSIRNWNFNPAPNFFPDMPIFFILMMLSSNFLFSAAAFAVIQYSLIVFLYKKIVEELVEKELANRIAVLSNLVLAIYLINTILDGTIYLSAYLLINSFHTSSFVFTLLGLLFALKYFNSGRYVYVVGYFILGIMGVFSDRLMVVSIGVTFFVSTLFYFKYSFSRIRVLIFGAVATLASFIGYWLVSYVQNHFLLKIDAPHKIFAFEDMLASFELYMSHVTNIHSGMFLVSVASLALGCVISAVFFFKKERYSKLIYVFFFTSVFSFAIVSATIVNGNYTGIDCLRYNFFPFYLGALNIPLLLFFFKREWYLKLDFIVIIVLSGIHASTGFSNISIKGFKEYCNFYPEKVKQLDSLVEKENLKHGIGTYWESKYYTLFSKKGIRVCTVYPECTKYYHGSNEDWYHNREFNFVIDKSIIHENLKQFLELDSIVLISENPSIIKVPDFHFKEDTWIPELSSK